MSSFLADSIRARETISNSEPPREEMRFPTSKEIADGTSRKNLVVVKAGKDLALKKMIDARSRDPNDSKIVILLTANGKNCALVDLLRRYLYSARSELDRADNKTRTSIVG